MPSSRPPRRNISRRTRRPGARVSGFTLMELLLVVVIIMIASGLAIPRMVRSYKGAKLRSSMRTVVMTSRYARGVAVLKQKHMAILFDQAKNSLEVVSVSSALGRDERSQFLDQRAAGPGGAPGEPPPFQVSSELVRPLADGIKIAEVKVGSKEQEYDGIYWVNFYPNGMCDRFWIRLTDEERKSATATIDPLSGAPKVEYAN
jgi:type II secretory pathway pseudopilin PulG